MRQRLGFFRRAALLGALLAVLSGCGEEPVPETLRQTRTTILEPELAQETVYAAGSVSLDASRTGEGYIMIRYQGTVEKVKVQVTVPDGTVYTYSLCPGNYETLPLTGGSGQYCVDVLENAYDDFYAMVFSQKLRVELADEFRPFLYPNQYVWYTPESKVYDFGIEISQKSGSDLHYVEKVYEYIIKNIEYDKELAQNVQVGYLPDLDRVMEEKKGICFDYAALMTALLRTQGIPTKLVIGYSGQAYHAWIDVYLEDVGWVSNIIYFDGSSWSLVDPTLGAGNRSSDVKRYVGDGSNYLAKYLY